MAARFLKLEKILASSLPHSPRCVYNLALTYWHFDSERKPFEELTCVSVACGIWGKYLVQWFSG